VLFAVVPDTEDPAGQPQGRPALVPLACADQGQLAGGRPCLGLVPLGSEVALEGGRRVVADGRGIALCEEEAGRAVGLTLAGAVEGAGWAIWPPSALDRVKPARAALPGDPAATCRGWCSFARTGHPRVRVTEEQRQRLAIAVARIAPELGRRAARLQVVQEITLDMEGDGKPERIYSVVVMEPKARYAFALSALLLERGLQLALLRRQNSDAIVVRGTLDLDGDGGQELHLLLVPTAGAGSGQMLLTLDAGGRAGLVGHYACEPAAE